MLQCENLVILGVLYVLVWGGRKNWQTDTLAVGGVRGVGWGEMGRHHGKKQMMNLLERSEAVYSVAPFHWHLARLDAVTDGVNLLRARELEN